MDFPLFGPDRAFGSNLGRSETQTPPGNSGGLAFCQPAFGPHLCHPEYKKHPFIYRLLVFFCSVVLDSYTLGASPEQRGPEHYPRLALC